MIWENIEHYVSIELFAQFTAEIVKNDENYNILQNVKLLSLIIIPTATSFISVVLNLRVPTAKDVWFNAQVVQWRFDF